MAELDFTSAWRIDKAQFIDLRSPREYAVDRIPGAVNIPLFDDGERKEIGRVYHKKSADEAGYLGLTYALPKVASLLRQIEELTDTNRVILYCWRGGSRSGSVYALSRSLNISCDYLTGGYKSYRNFVNDYFAKPCGFNLVVLCGLTGVGKTRILNRLKENGRQTVDLEGLAQHRGSAFGDIGFGAQPSQKAFESSLWFSLSKFRLDQPVFVECESRRVGNNIIPAAFFDSMKAAPTCLLYDKLENRAARIIQEYCPEKNNHSIIDSLERLTDKIGKNTAKQLIEEVKTGNFVYVVEQLLAKYYDPLYGYADRPTDGYDLCIDVSLEEQAVKTIEENW